MTTPDRDSVQSGSAPIIDVVRHEERLHLTTERIALERVKIERVVVTEQRTITVEVSHEELRITRDPVSGLEPLSGRSAGETPPLVIVLSAEQIVVTKTVVPVERVTVGVTTVTEQQHITETVASERIDYLPPTSDAAST